ncbi:MAG: hypothetical protein V3V16_10450 [Melioribacteraceae bacterium]
MNKTLKISQGVRRKVALVLLINFLFSTIYLALPQESCNGMCDLDINVHTCSTMEVEKNCCEMMGMNTSKTSSCDMEISDVTCDYEISILTNSTFIVPKIIDSKIELATISILDSDINNNFINSFILFNDVTPKINPPIYLSVSSFLI